MVRVRHGQGYTCYASHSHGLEQDLLVLVPSDDPVKLVRLSVRNNGDRPRRLSATFYAEWVLGTVRENASLQVVCEYDAGTGAVLARSAWAGDFAGRIAFVAVGPRPHSATADRAEFLGRNGSPSAPAALRRSGLSGRDGPLLDPCAALMTPVTLAPGQAEEVVFVLGQADTVDQVRYLVTTYTAPGRAQEALRAIQGLWDQILGAVQVRTPDPALDLMLNRWLLYQVLACRVWGRSAFYQSSGAYGYRDQLQDVMALVTSAPQEARAQILRSAARQFEEGDVQHWWHPPSGRGIRTRITDDLYFLPLAVEHYVTATGDTALLDERVAFLKSAVLPARPGRGLRPAGGQRAKRDRLRALRARAGTWLPDRVARPAPDGHRGLGRWHEQGRYRRQGRERLERLVLHHSAEGVRGIGRRAKRRAADGLVPGAGRGPAGRAGGACLGRRLVSPRLLRRRHASRLSPERRVPDHRHSPGLGGDLRHCGPGAINAGYGRGRRAPGTHRQQS